MKLERVRSALADSCRKLWAAQLNTQFLDSHGLTPLEEQAIVFAAMDDRYGIAATEEEIENLLKVAEKAKRAWTQIQSALLQLASLRLDRANDQVIAAPKHRHSEPSKETQRVM